MVGDWRTFLLESPANDVMNDLRKHERTGRPLGRESFLQHLENTLSRVLRKQKPGPKGKKVIIK